AGSVPVYIGQGQEAARQWLRTEGFNNIDGLNKVIERTASSWHDKVKE
ncbi:tagatose-bisphosphate aldolase, partial [Streptococcus uberis]|nr:tagatose-bisphosphate aldolase [Streptococcus uberis]